MVIKDILLEKVQVACSERLNCDFLMEATVETFLDDVSRSMELRLKAFVWATPEKSFEHSYPATAGQHLKLQYAPKWLIKRWPVKLIKTIYHVREVFPEYKALNQKSSMWLRTATDFKNMPL